MGLFDFLKRPKKHYNYGRVDRSSEDKEQYSVRHVEHPCISKSMNNPLYCSEDYHQDTNQSIVSETELYDFTNFSDHEKSVINNVIQTSFKKYPVEYRSIGLANEASSLKYKARYVVFEVIILLYQGSDNPIDQFAVAMAYNSKGAHFRSKALKYFELSKEVVTPETAGKFLYFSPFSVLLNFSKLYEKEHEYEKAVELAEEAGKYGNTNDRITVLKEKMQNPKKKRKRSISQDQIELEQSITVAAELFMKENNLQTKINAKCQ